MHLPDGFLSKNVAGGLIGVSALALGFAITLVKKHYFSAKAILKKNLALEGGFSVSSGFELSKKFKEKVKPRILKAAVLGSLVFALQMLNFPIAGGTSGHFLGGALLALLVGPFEGFLVISLILMIQSLVFADGGVIALGANIFNMGIVGTFLIFYFFSFLWKKISHTNKNFIALTFGISWFSVVIASFFCAAEIYFSGSVGKEVFMAMTSYHVLIGVVEGVVTTVIVYYFFKHKDLPLFKSQDNEK